MTLKFCLFVYFRIERFKNILPTTYLIWDKFQEVSISGHKKLTILYNLAHYSIRYRNAGNPQNAFLKFQTCVQSYSQWYLAEIKLLSELAE